MKVSVIIPAYNAITYVCRALDSLKLQTRPADEIIVSDDGSVDGTADMVRKWAQSCGYSVVIVQGSNGGIAAARNRALAVATGQAVALLDADDEMLPDQLKLLMAGLERFEDAALVCGDVLTRYETGREIAGNTSRNLAEYVDDAGFGEWKKVRDPFRANVRCNLIPNQCTVIRRSALEACGRWDDVFRAVEDRDLFLRLAKFGGFYFLPETLAVKYEREASVSRNRFMMSAYQFRALSKVRTYADSTAELMAAITDAAHEYIYHASCRGMGALRSARKEIRSAGIQPKLGELVKSWFRALKVGAKPNPSA